eukprot:21744-Hanusia_phi.AAC.3
MNVYEGERLAVVRDSEPVSMELKPLNPGITSPYEISAGHESDMAAGDSTRLAYHVHDPQTFSPNKRSATTSNVSEHHHVPSSHGASAVVSEISSEKTCMEPWAKKERSAPVARSSMADSLPQAAELAGNPPRRGQCRPLAP